MNPETAPWRNYPMSLPGYDPLSVNGPELQRRLDDPDGTIFTEDGDDDINLRITDFHVVQNGHQNNVQVTSTLFRDASAVEANINNEREDHRVRIISIFSERTIEPLQVTSELMRKILFKYQVHPDFLCVVLSFGEEPHFAEGSSSNIAVRSENQDSKVSYQIQYVEENYRKGYDPWSFRHTGVYHHCTPNFDLFILLHPMENSVVEKRLEALRTPTQANQDQLLGIYQNPFRLHFLLFSSYFNNWRWYFRYLGQQFDEKNNLAMVVKLENADAASTFKLVQGLRNTNDFVLFARACCSGNLNIAETLTSSPHFAPLYILNDDDDLRSQASTLRDYIKSSDVLVDRIRNATDLIGYTLTLHNQIEAANVSHDLRDMTEKLKDLTQDTVDDSTTVKVITFVSALYLPGSFVATIYGMNFFVFDPVKRNIRIAGDFWIFIATWLPLALLTGALYQLVMWLDRRAKAKGKVGLFGRSIDKGRGKRE